MLVAFNAGELLRLEHANTILRARQTALHDAGVPLTYEEIQAIRPPLADRDNGANILEPLLPQLDTFAHGHPIGMKAVPMFGEAALPIWREAWSPELLSAVDGFMTEWTRLFDQLEAMDDFPEGRFPLVVIGKPPNFLELRHVWAARAAARLELLKACYNAQFGCVDQALSGARRMVNIGATIDDDPSLIASMIHTAIRVLACDTIDRSLAGGVADDETLVQLILTLQAQERHETLVWGLRGEIAEIRMLFDGVPVKYYHLGVKRRFAIDEAAGLEVMNSLLLASQAGDRMLAQLEATKTLAAQRPAKMKISSKLLSVAFRAIEFYARAEAITRCTIAGLACERFRMAHARWPTSLGELVPAYLDNVPTDPFNGQPIAYDDQGDVLVIYSVGDNGQDDGGNFARIGKDGPQADVGMRLLPPYRRLNH